MGKSTSLYIRIEPLPEALRVESECFFDAVVQVCDPVNLLHCKRFIISTNRYYLII